MILREFEQLFNDGTFSGSVRKDVPLSSCTTICIGGAARLFVEPDNEPSAIFAVRLCLENSIPFFVLGGGSNVVVNDDGLDVVISTRRMSGELSVSETDGGCLLRIGAGTSWGAVLSFCRKNNIGGFEPFAGLSGTVGGALVMNASCFGRSACDALAEVRYFDCAERAVKTYTKHDDDWGYKKSPFRRAVDCSGRDGRGVAGCPRREGNGENAQRLSRGERLLPADFFILSADFSVSRGFDCARAAEVCDARKAKGHFLAPSAGSAFKNDAAAGVVAGKLIDECGLRGLRIGGAQIAPWHGNFIINPEQNARASDVRRLAETVVRTVYEKKHVVLEPEILFV